MLNQIKQHTGLKINEIAQKLGVTKPTIHNWENKNSWPLWALEACGMEVRAREDAGFCEWEWIDSGFQKYWVSDCSKYYSHLFSNRASCPNCGQPITIKYKETNK